jgi:hypothetical protein
MTAVHTLFAYPIPAAFLLLALWALVSFIRNKAPGNAFWRLLAGIQVVLALQIIVGATLYLMGNRPGGSGPEWLHYVYGGLFPLALLIGGHRFAKRYEGIPWVVFGVVALINFGLTFRALQTGMGWFD